MYSFALSLWYSKEVYAVCNSVSLASTSELTYSMKWTTTGGTIYLNRTFDNTDNANYQRTPSCITLMEILA